MLLCHRKDAIDNAAVAFQSWKETPPGFKSAIFKKFIALLESDESARKITEAVVEETGCVAPWAKDVNIGWSLPFLEAVCDMPYKAKGEILVSDLGARSFVNKVPMGVMYVSRSLLARR